MGSIRTPAIRAWVVSLLLIAGSTLAACDVLQPAPVQPTETSDFVFGLILVGPLDDHGWSEAHYSAGQYVENRMPNSRMLVLDSLNPDARPDTTLEQAVIDMIEQGARLIFVTSDDFAADTRVVAEQNPEITFVHISGDHARSGEAPSNLGNYMARMEYGKMISGCAAALNTETGVIGYLGPLINAETRRLASSAYLGARYCYDEYRGLDPDDLRFMVRWIGFWFHIPGVTEDPMLVANEMFDEDVDVIMSGIDTTEAIQAADLRAAEGEEVRVIPYDYKEACEEGPEVCLGVPYFNWGPGYLEIAKQVRDGTWTSRWDWVGPDWDDINNEDTSVVGFLKGPALQEAQASQLDRFVTGLANNAIVLFQGPLNYQDGSPFLVENQVASDEQIWYMPQLLEGMHGVSR